MAAPDGVVCAVAVNNGVAGIHPRSRATNGRAFEALQSPIPVPAAAGVAGVFIAGVRSTGQCNTACSLLAGVSKPKVFRGR